MASMSERIRHLRASRSKAEPVELPRTITESTPPKQPFTLFRRYPDAAKFRAKAKSQECSPFFSRLPPEIRELVYLELWRAAGLSQHVLVRRGGYTHVPCLTDHRAPDDRQLEIDHLWNSEWEPLQEDWSLNPSYMRRDEVWGRRLLSAWGNHWRCEESAASLPRKQTREVRSAFLAILLTCKKFYLECMPSLYQNVTFVFTSLDTAHDYFVTRNSPVADRIESLQLSIQFRERLQPGVLDELGEYWYEELGLWGALRDKIGALASLRRVEIWLDALSSYRVQLLVTQPGILTFPPILAPKLTLDLPVEPSEIVAEVETAANPVAVVKRGLPQYHTSKWEPTKISNREGSGYLVRATSWGRRRRRRVNLPFRRST